MELLRKGLTRGKLISCGWQEDAPPISMSIEVPNGTYHVQLGVFLVKRPGGRFGAAMRLKAEDESAFRVFSFLNTTPVSLGPVAVPRVALTTLPTARST